MVRTSPGASITLVFDTVGVWGKRPGPSVSGDGVLSTARKRLTEAASNLSSVMDPCLCLPRFLEN